MLADDTITVAVVQFNFRFLGGRDMDMIDGHALLLRATRELGASIDIFASSTRGTSPTSKTFGTLAVRIFFLRAERSLSKAIRAL